MKKVLNQQKNIFSLAEPWGERTYGDDLETAGFIGCQGTQCCAGADGHIGIAGMGLQGTHRGADAGGITLNLARTTAHEWESGGRVGCGQTGVRKRGVGARGVGCG